MFMAFLAIDKFGDEYIFRFKPDRDSCYWSDERLNKDCVGSNDTPYYHSSEIELPKGTIKVLTGKELTWDDEPIEIC